MSVFALYSSQSFNVGDDIQTLVVEQMLDSVDGYLDRENISGVEESGVLVANGWWKHRSCDFPPSVGVVPAYVGVHIADPKLVEQHVDHFLAFAPVGCRDHFTLEMMQSLGVPAYLSNCLTLGLERWLEPDEDGPVLAVDVPKGCRLPDEAHRLSHRGPLSSHPFLMRGLCRSRLSEYQVASLVITGRLHVALPCIAFGTPVIFVTDTPSDPRLGCLADLIPLQSVSKSIPANGHLLSPRRREKLRQNARGFLIAAVENARRLEQSGHRSYCTASAVSTTARQPKSPSRIKVFGIGPAKSGTHSLAEMFGEGASSAHEPDADRLLGQILNRGDGPQRDEKIRNYLLAKEQRRSWRIDSSQLNYFVLVELLELFPEARFILTVRDCFTWLDSFINDSLRRVVSTDWQRLRDKRFKPEVYPHLKGEDDVLLELGLYSLRGYLSYWEEHYATVLKLVPESQLLKVRVDELGTRAHEIADFVGLPHSSIFSERAHVFKNPQKRNVLSLLRQEYLLEEVAHFCPTMRQLFPEVRSLTDVGLA